ncbi:MAG: class I SAM-dependent methyltransferase [Nitrospirota bacterium]
MSNEESQSVPGVQWISSDTTIHHQCPICQDMGTKYLVLKVNNPFSWSEHLFLYRCGDCGSHFYKPFQFPTYESSDGYSTYAAKYYVEQEAGFESLISPLASVDIARGASYLEVGCGFGFAVSFARNVLGCDAVGVEPSKIGKMGGTVLGEKIFCDYLENVSDLAGKKFDIVYSAQTVEHVPDPVAFLDLLIRYLSPKGILILATPNAESVSRQTLAGPLLETLAPGFHYSVFNPRAMEEVLKRCGLEHIVIQKPQNQMIVWASRQPIMVCDSWELVSDRMIEYLNMVKSSPNPWVVCGALQRLFRTQVNRSQYDLADQTYEQLRTVLKSQYGFDVFSADKTLALLSKATSLVEIGEQLPYNLAAMYHYAGKLFLNHRHEYAIAEQLFETAFLQVPLFMKHRFVGEFAFLWWQMKYHVGLARERQGRTKEACEVFSYISTYYIQESMAQLGLTGPAPELIDEASYHEGEAALRHDDVARARLAFSRIFIKRQVRSDGQWRLRAAERIADLLVTELKQLVGCEWENPKISETIRARILSSLGSTP